MGCWQNKLMRVIYHAACALLSRGRPHPLLLATPVTCHAMAGKRRGKTSGVDRRGERGGGAEDGHVITQRGELMRRGERQMRTILSVKCQTLTAAADHCI